MIIIFFGSVVNEIVQPLQYTVFDTVTKVRERGRGEREDRGSWNISYLYICPLNVFIIQKKFHTLNAYVYELDFIHLNFVH